MTTNARQQSQNFDHACGVQFREGDWQGSAMLFIWHVQSTVTWVRLHCRSLVRSIPAALRPSGHKNAAKPISLAVYYVARCIGRSLDDIDTERTT